MLRKALPMIALAICQTACATADNDSQCTAAMFPTQIRLAYWGDHGMAVSWNTKQKLTKPTVFFATDVGNHASGGNLNRKASSDVSVTYPTSSTFNNHVVIDGLVPHTTYLYRPQCGNQTYRFTTARSAGKGRDEFKFAMVGDMGTMGPDGLSTRVGTGAANPLQPGDLNTMQSLLAYQDQYDFVWHVGDIAYADSWLKEEKGGYITPLNKTDHGVVYDRILNQFYDEIEPISRSVPYMVGPGNHEANCDNGSDLSLCVVGQLNFTGYRTHWNMPGPISGGVENFWYSWDNGPVHFIQFNTETDFPNAPDEPGGEGAENAGPFAPTGAQLAWLEKDLARVDRKKTPWVIVGGHRPWYVSSSACIECRDAFEPLFIKYGVDLVLHGHKHFYEREAAIGPKSSVIQEIDANPTLPWYVINGAGGHYDGLDQPATLVNSSRKVIVEYGWSLFTVHNCTHLTTQFVASRNGSVLDTATIAKERECTMAEWD